MRRDSRHDHDFDLVVVDSSSGLPENGYPERDLTVLLEQVPSDVAVLVGAGDPGTGPVVTPFGGAEHDWSAIELAAWLADSLGTTLRLARNRSEHNNGPTRCQQAPCARFDARAAGGRDNHRASPRPPRRGRRAQRFARCPTARDRTLHRWPSEASDRCAWLLLHAPGSPRCSSDAAFARAASRQVGRSLASPGRSHRSTPRSALMPLLPETQSVHSGIARARPVPATRPRPLPRKTSRGVGTASTPIHCACARVRAKGRGRPARCRRS